MSVKPPAEYAYLPSYVRKGLALKYARGQQHNGLPPSQPSPTPSLITDCSSSASVDSPVNQPAQLPTDKVTRDEAHIIPDYKDSIFDEDDIYYQPSQPNTASRCFSNIPNNFTNQRRTLNTPNTSREVFTSHACCPSSISSDEQSTRQPLPIGTRPMDLLPLKKRALVSTSKDAKLVSVPEHNTSNLPTASNYPIQSTHLSVLAEPFTPTILQTSPRVTDILQKGSWRTNLPPRPYTMEHYQPVVPPTVPSPVPRCPKVPASNYRGDPTNPNNMSDDIPDCLNTSVFMEKLPGDLDYPGLLYSLRGTGRIFSVKIMAPVVARPGSTAAGANNINTSAAKVHFWDRAGVNRFFSLCRAGLLLVGGRTPLARPNHYRTRPRPQHEHNRSRVVIIQGPHEIVNRRYLEWFFDLAFDWDVEAVFDLKPKTEAIPSGVESGDLRRLEYRFASYRAQAVTAARRMEHAAAGWPMLPNRRGVELNEAERALWQHVKVEFGVDPCEPVEEGIEERSS